MNYRNFLDSLTTKIRLVSRPEEGNRPSRFVPAVTGHKFRPEGYSETAFAGTGYPTRPSGCFWRVESTFEAFSQPSANFPPSHWKLAQFNPVAVRVLNERLQRPVRSFFSIQADRLMGIQVAFPFVKAIDHQRKMPTTVVRMHGLVAITNQVQFLIFT